MEVCSTLMIMAIAKQLILAAMFWSFLSPLLNFAFYNYFVEAKDRRDRMVMTVVNGVGYAVGTGIILYASKFYYAI